MTSPDEHDNEEARRGRLVRRVLSQGPTPEQQLEELIAQRRDELDAHAERLRESITELERREELLRDSRASVERMLRLGTADLEAREAELTSFLASLTERETSLSDAEADLARRRQEVGAVELKRAAVERRERAVAARENELAELEQRSAELALDPPPKEALVEIVFVPGERYRLVEIDATPLTPGHVLDVEGSEYAVARIGRSPLPADARRCAYLVRGRDGLSGRVGSS